MQQVSQTQHFGPISFVEGVTRINGVTFLFSAFVCISMLSGMNFFQGYILTEHLNIPAEQQGRVAGTLAFWTEIVSILLVAPFGVLSDRIGRRPIIVFGIAIIGIAFGLYPFATSVAELTVYRLIFAVGAAAAATMVGTIANDYPQETSRGKLIGVSGVMTSLGAVFMAGVLGQIPAVLRGQGVDAVVAGQAMFAAAAALCFIAALAFRIGLQGGTPVSYTERLPYGALVRRGLLSAKNPRIALSYAVSFTGRGDHVVKVIFLSLWILQVGRAEGLSAGEALARAGTLYVMMMLLAVVWHLIFGFILDRVSRVTGVIIAMVLGAAGYLSMGLITSPLDYAMLPAFAILALGSASSLQSSMSLVGQEAPHTERGAIIGMNGLFGAIGIMVGTLAGGWLFDNWAPYAPFVLIGIVQSILLVLAIIVRRVAPGPIFAEPRLKPAQ